MGAPAAKIFAPVSAWSTSSVSNSSVHAGRCDSCGAEIKVIVDEGGFVKDECECGVPIFSPSFDNVIARLNKKHRQGYVVSRVRRGQDPVNEMDVLNLHGYVILYIQPTDRTQGLSARQIRLDWHVLGFDMQESETCEFKPFGNNAAPVLGCSAAVHAAAAVDDYDVQVSNGSVKDLSDALERMRKDDKKNRYSLGQWNCNHMADDIAKTYERLEVLAGEGIPRMNQMGDARMCRICI